MITESQQQIESSIVRVLLIDLQCSKFHELKSEEQALRLDETQRMLKSKTVEMSTKRQLLNFLDALRGISKPIEARVQAIRDDWDTPPL